MNPACTAARRESKLQPELAGREEDGQTSIPVCLFQILIGVTERPPYSYSRRKSKARVLRTGSRKQPL